MRAPSLMALVPVLFLTGGGWTGFLSTVIAEDGGSTGQTDRPSDKAKPGEVQWIGEMRKVMHQGDLTGHVDLRSLANRPHLYAVGPLEGLRGEVTIWDGKASLATLKNREVVILPRLRGLNRRWSLAFAERNGGVRCRDNFYGATVVGILQSWSGLQNAPECRLPRQEKQSAPA
jgi:hypothetical protein